METHFTGGVFSDAINGGRAGATITLAREGISARLDDGTTFVIPFRECQVEVGGFSGRMVFCRNADRSITIFCEDKRFPDALSRASTGILDPQLDHGLKKQRQASRRSWMVGTALVVTAIVLVIGAYWGISRGARAAVAALPTSVDRQLGTTVFESMELEGPLVDDPAIVEPIQSIVQQLAPHAAIEGLDFKVHIVDADIVNAFALPGGTIVVYTGLIEQADRAEQVAGVIGHEMAHATLRHGLKQIGQSMGVWVAISLWFGNTEGLIGFGVDLLGKASVNSYSREQENEADIEGVRMLHAAGIDPNGLAEFFQILEDQHGEFPQLAAWISTHPSHAARIESVRQQIAKFPEKTYEPLPVDWQALKANLKSKSRPDSKPDVPDPNPKDANPKNGDSKKQNTNKSHEAPAS